MQFKYLMIFLLFLSLAFADDEELIISCGGDEELRIGCDFGDEELGVFYASFIGIPEPPSEPAEVGYEVTYERTDIVHVIIDLIVGIIAVIASLSVLIGLYILYSWIKKRL